MTNFPIKVRYIDKNEEQVVNSPDEIQKGRTFVVEEIFPKWGRKPIPSELIGVEDYE